MSIDAKFRQQYYNFLKKCLMTVDFSKKYEDTCAEYESLRTAINAELRIADSICSDAEYLIDKESGKLKAEAKMLFLNNAKLSRMINELLKLWLKKQSFGEFGWEDEMMNNIDSVIAIAEYSAMEEEIIEKLGLDEGQRFIYEVKKEILALEEKLGTSFFREDVLKLRDLFKIKVLFSDSSEIDVNEKDNLNQKSLILTNKNKESFSYKQWAKITHNGVVFIELEHMEELRVGKIKYYKLEITETGQKLTLVENKELEKELDVKRDKLEIGV